MLPETTQDESFLREWFWNWNSACLILKDSSVIFNMKLRGSTVKSWGGVRLWSGEGSPPWTVWLQYLLLVPGFSASVDCGRQQGQISNWVLDRQNRILSSTATLSVVMDTGVDTFCVALGNTLCLLWADNGRQYGAKGRRENSEVGACWLSAGGAHWENSFQCSLCLNGKNQIVLGSFGWLHDLVIWYKYQVLGLWQTSHNMNYSYDVTFLMLATILGRMHMVWL